MLALTEQQKREIGHGQAEQVIVGGGVHEIVADDHHADGDVPDHPGDEYEHVDDGYREHDVQRQVLGPPGPQQIVVDRLGGGRAVFVAVQRHHQIRSARRVVHARPTERTHARTHATMAL